MVEHAGDHRIHHLYERFRTGVKARVGRQNRCAGLQEQFKIFDMHQVQRRFARHQDQLLALLQHHVSGAQQDVFARAVRDAAQRAHAAGDDDHRVEGIRAAGERRVHAFDIVHFDARWQAESIGQFLRDDRLAVAGDDDLDVMRARVEVVEETLGVKRATGSGDGNNDFQSGKRILAHYGGVELSGQARFAQPIRHRQGEFNRRMSRSRRGDEAEVVSKPKIRLLTSAAILEGILSGAGDFCSQQGILLESTHPFRTIRRVLNGWKRVVAMVALAALAGCSSSPGLSSRLTRVPVAPRGEPLRADSVRQPNDAVAGVTDPGPTGIPATGLASHDETFLAPPPPNSARAPSGGPLVNDWVSLQGWSETNHFSAPQRLSSGSLTYELRTVGGVIAVTAGSQLAHVNGVSYWLGYPPRSTNGELFVHALDAQKNLLPLARLSTLPPGTNPVVVIDPGHGGENTGARSVRDDRFEKDFALDWALRLRPLLEVGGWKVYLTRTNDVDLLLPDRVALAEELNASLFLSLHFNSAARRDQSGLETYCLTPAGLPSTLTRDYEDDTALVFPNNTFDTQNLQYALRLHGALVETTGGIDRGVRRARFMGVLRAQNRPAVLLEGGYLSNPREAQLIGQPEYRQKLAEAVAKALLVTHEAPVAANTLFDPALAPTSAAANFSNARYKSRAASP